MLVVVEGIECSGKTTVAGAIAEKCGMRSSAFPRRDTATGVEIDRYLKGGWWCDAGEYNDPGSSRDAKLSALAFQALQIANRLEAWDDLRNTNSMISSDSLVLSRYWQSGWVYGQMDGLDPEWLLKVHAPLPKPNLNLLLDISADTAIRRLAERGSPRERYDDKVRLDTASRLYRQLWGSEGLSKDWWLVIDAEKPLEEVSALACAAIARAGRRIGAR